MRFGVPESHQSKIGTPTMGGSVMIVSIIISILLWTDIGNRYVVILASTIILYGIIGGLDDYKKILKSNYKGISAKTKLVLQFVVASIIVHFLNVSHNITYSNTLVFPFLRDFAINAGVIYTVIRLCTMVGSANAVNLTDGLDGLVTIPLIVSTGCLGIFSYLQGHYAYAKYLFLYHIPGVGEIAVVCGIIMGSLMGFLWFNAKPAKIFMGDIGSLSLGATLGTIAVMTKNEILFMIIGGLFVIETMSVIIQIVSFRMFGKRVFRIAPLHHHFEKFGWSETQVVIRFWIISILFGVIGLCALKVR